MPVLDHFVSDAPILAVGGGVLLCMTAAAVGGGLLRRRRGPEGADEGGEGYIVSAVLGLLALLLGFTFSLAVDRFETRRALVLEEANAIGTTYLRSQLLPEPHRARISALLVAYTDNRLSLVKARPEQAGALLARNNAQLTDLWAATAAAFVDIKGQDFSSAFLDSVNTLIDLDAARKAASTVRVPSEVFLMLFAYAIVTAGVLGYVLVGRRGGLAAGVMLLLLNAAFLLVIDIDRPGRGGVRESQAPMERMRASLAAQPPAAFDRYLPTPPLGVSPE